MTMDTAPQSFIAPDGTEMVVLTRAEFDRLTGSTGDDDAHDIAAAKAALAESGGFLVPHEVVRAILAGTAPVAAWRAYRGVSQMHLARLSGQSQSGISQLERRRGDGALPFGRIETRRRVAAALEVPLWALDPSS